MGPTSARDSVPLEALLEDLAHALLPTAAALCRDADEARELIEDTLSRVYERLPQLRDPQAVRGWARQILVRQFLDRQRLLRRRPQRRLDVVLDRSTTQPSDVLIDVRLALARLGREDRALLVLHYWTGLTLAECAAQLGIPEGTCKSRLHRILARMRAQLEI